jgi:hypothetical protein
MSGQTPMDTNGHVQRDERTDKTPIHTSPQSQPTNTAIRFERQDLALRRFI